ncbi:hypothetical protein V3O24_14475 [Methylobacter sp. Wu8]|uniref:hypothetical protein n=1 Tax=Methylobacter sp. Wu8 TaxID=3118457 RepID=UPI002F341D0B
MIGSINAYSTTQSGGATAFKAASKTEPASGAPENQSTTNTQTSSTQTISTLARQLADSASRAEVRDKTLSRSELADKAKSLLSKISGDSYQANKKTHDSEVPKTDDPELLARAKQATEFVNRSSNNGNEKNPFVGLSREQLANVIYDDSGTYTVNERRAAWMESSKQEEEWSRKVTAQAMDEYNRTGKMTNFFRSVLDHFKDLPAIEQAQYPKNYASDLESKISLDFNYRTHQAEGKSKDPMSLIDELFSQSPKVW